MAVDVENQLHDYCQWMEQRVGVALSRPASTSRVSGIARPDASASTVVDLRRAPDNSNRRRGVPARVLVAAATLALLAASAVVVARQLSGTTHHVASVINPSDASWYVLDPALAEELHAERVENSDGLAGPLACRRYDNENQSCAEFVGSRLVRYRIGNGQKGEILIETEYGPAQSNMWQMAGPDQRTITIGGHEAVIAGGGAGSPGGRSQLEVTFEPSPGVRVLILAEVDEALIVRIAESLTLANMPTMLPLVFGDTESPVGPGVAPRYFAGYLRLATVPWSTKDHSDDYPCVGGLELPFNNGSNCVGVDRDDEITITVASPSPAGTIIIAAVPAATARVEAQAFGEPSRPLRVVSLPGFALQLVFADLDEFIPGRLVAFAADGSVLDTTDVISTGGAPLGYLPKN